MLRSLTLAFVILATTVTCSAPRASVASPSPLSTLRPTQRLIPVDYVAFDSPLGGYSICRPASFETRPARLFAGGAVGDSFVDPRPAVYPRVAWLVWESAPDESSADYASAAIENLNANGIGVLRLPPLAVDGQVATVVTYPRLTPDAQQQRYTVRQAYWADSGKGRAFTLAYAPIDEAAGAEIFEKMLACYRSGG